LHRKTTDGTTARKTGEKNKMRGEKNAMTKYVSGGEEGLEKIIREIDEMRKEIRGEREKMKEEIEKAIE